MWDTEDKAGQWVCRKCSRAGQLSVACSKVSSSDSQAGQSVELLSWKGVGCAAR